MDKADLLEIHQERKSDNSHHTEQLLNILGGIDNILTLILSSDIPLESNQISQIHDTITTKKSPDSLFDLVEMEENKNQPEFEWTYYFNKNNTYLHSLFDRRIATKMINVIFSKFMFIFLLILATVDIIAYSHFTVNVGGFVYLYLARLFWLFIGILIILSTNKRTFSLVKNRFELWFKLYYCVQWTIFWYIYLYFMDAKITNINIIILRIIVAINQILAILCVCLYDGLNVNIWFKIVSAALLAIYFSYYSIIYNFYSYLNGNDPSLIQLNFIGMSISAFSQIGSSGQILAIFFWKQSILSLFNKRKCTLICCQTPYVEWLDDNAKNNVNIQISSMTDITTSVLKRSANDNDAKETVKPCNLDNCYNDEMNEEP